LQEVRKNLDLGEHKLHSQLSKRIQMQTSARNQQMKANGLLNLNLFLEQELMLENPEERRNRFFDTNLNNRRSVSECLTQTQRKKYEFIVEKNIKRERQSLSHFRYNKMKKLILKEVRNAI
jgi:hypothetical protein